MESTGVDFSSSVAPKLFTPTPVEVWAQLRPDWLILEGEEAVYVHERWLASVRDRRCQLEVRQSQTEPSQTKPSQAEHSQAEHSQTKDTGIGQSQSLYPLVLIAESDPQQFLVAFWAALLANWHIALANPRWGTQEWQSVNKLIAPTVVWGEAVPEHIFPTDAFVSDAQSVSAYGAASQILIPTGGTSGHIKFAHHTWQTLLASVNGFCQYFSPHSPVDSYCVLPLYHVSGLMQVLRSVVSGGQIAIAPFKTLDAAMPAAPLPFGPGSECIHTECIHTASTHSSGVDAEVETGARGGASAPALRFLSLVPTQLHRLLQSGKSQWLRQFHAVLLGGAPAWSTLLDLAQQQTIPISLSYGMTETAAMVTALKPDAFLSGNRSNGSPLPHATIHIFNGNTAQSLPTAQSPHKIGQIVISASSLALQSLPEQPLCTDDLGYFSAEGQLYVTGRASQTIISGGENIFPTEVEAAIRSTGQVKDICVFGLPDAQWGEAVTAVYVPCSDAITVQSLQRSLSTAPADTSLPRLSRYKHPKHWFALPSLPRNAQGKLNRQAVMAQIQPLLQSLLHSK
ncbi:MAG: AMP-binding protein [Phormidesmis sp.]